MTMHDLGRVAATGRQRRCTIGGVCSATGVVDLNVGCGAVTWRGLDDAPSRLGRGYAMVGVHVDAYFYSNG
jgi:hypothetical protein